MKYLDEIIAWHRKRVKDEAAENLEIKAKDREDSFSFSKALKDFGIIAEIKRRSPSKGDFQADINPASVARDFETGGASCISVLTDEEFFGGSLKDLEEVKQAVNIPILRKDFTLSSQDVVRAAKSGADAVLLIMAALADPEVREFYLKAAELGLDTLFEIHTAKELERVLEIYETENEAFKSVHIPLCILVNQRNLKTFEEDPERAIKLASSLPDEAVKIAASAISSQKAVGEIKEAGYQGVLIGEYLMLSDDPVKRLREILPE